MIKQAIPYLGAWYDLINNKNNNHYGQSKMRALTFK
jgi:hypothetical protein